MGGVALILTGLGQLLQLAGGLQAVVDLDPGAIILGVNLALAVLLAAARTVDQALGALGDGANSTCLTQDALTAEAAGFFPHAEADSFA